MPLRYDAAAAVAGFSPLPIRRYYDAADYFIAMILRYYATLRYRAFAAAPLSDAIRADVIIFDITPLM